MVSEDKTKMSEIPDIAKVLILVVLEDGLGDKSLNYENKGGIMS